jgi:proteic killer suppression protein
MIRSIRHKGLRRLYESGDPQLIGGDMRERIAEILTLLYAAESIDDLNLPGYRLHALEGKLRDYWSIRVTGNWRVIFRFIDGAAEDVDLVDYH